MMRRARESGRDLGARLRDVLAESVGPRESEMGARARGELHGLGERSHCGGRVSGGQLELPAGDGDVLLDGASDVLLRGGVERAARAREVTAGGGQRCAGDGEVVDVRRFRALRRRDIAEP